LSITYVEELIKIIEAEQSTLDTEVRYTNGKREIKNLGFTGICVEIVSWKFCQLLVIMDTKMLCI